MAVVNIIGNIDAEGILKDFKPFIDERYGGDPTGASPAMDVRDKIIDENFAVLRLGYHDHNVLPGYTRLVSSKNSTIGYEIRPEDKKDWKGKTYLTNTYNLSISAKNGDKLRWWGHTIVPNLATQAIISSVSKPGSSAQPPPQFTNMNKSNVTFYNTGGADDLTNLMKGLYIESKRSFCITCDLRANNIGEQISYDIELMLMSAPLRLDNGDTKAYPIVKVVVDPTIFVVA